ncbi:MAG TPA: FAD-dependent oxidoreductase [Burkholderiales bacterium]|nr:FAD-dependent oxidoreductase [Burkholderiales bacterium]
MNLDNRPAKPELAAHLIEEGAASMQLAGPAGRKPAAKREYFDVVVIGGGQAGLSVGYHLSRAGVRFTILDANQRIGDSWRKRWDSLRLFTPAKLDGLAGMPFPAPRNYFPTKDEMADYLEAYAARFDLPVRNAVRVDRLFQRGARYVVRAGTLELEAGQVVVAMAGYQRPNVPAFAAGLSGGIVQMHSRDYCNLTQLKRGGVVLVGAGNSGADIALETARGGHLTWMSGPDTGHVPVRPEGFLGRNVIMPLVVGFFFHRVLTLRTPLGRKVRPHVLAKGAPLIRVKPADLAAARVQRVPRVVGVRNGQPLLADGRTLDVANVIWCTGFRPGMEWIDLPIFGDGGQPMHQAGLVASHPGLYFVGLKFLYAMSSSMIHGVGRDAARIVKAITERIDGAPARTVPLAVAPAVSERT